jgi:hypothetical protein
MPAIAQQSPLHQSHPIKCATSPLTLNSKGKISLQSSLPTSFRDSVLSPSGLFMIFYDATASDTDSITTPAYVQRALEEADSAYDFEVNDLGYSPPAFTEGTHHNIYLSPLHIDYADFQPYGATFPMEGGELSPSPSGVERIRTYCVVDNSFTNSVYATHGFDALRITIFHEFFHHIQFSEYGHPPNYQDPFPNYVFFQEMSSVWMEWLSTPTVKDYLQYVGKYLSTLDDRFDKSPGGGYGQYIFFAYLTHRYDTSIVRKIWEYYRDSSADPITCIDQVLRKYGSSFCQEYETFGAELQKAGVQIAAPDIPDPELLPVDTIPVAAVPLNSPVSFPSLALSLQYFSANLGDQSCVEIIARDTNREVQSTGTISFSSLGNPPTLTFDGPTGYCDTELCSPGLQVFPSPFVVDGSNEAYLLASNSNLPPVSVVMNILDLRNNEIRSAKLEAIPFKGSWNAVWDGRDNNGNLVQSGEYLYTLHVDGALKAGKIVVVRK